ncbi:hypothetical protein [Janthinobacterium sp. RB2R34]|uniref:hypothetical protein n=1 Tax=Janthinobacterium sp. RB2R34 TaxID=3424193 RepID=UPI003F527DA1
MSDQAHSTYVHESSRKANQDAGFARAAAMRATIAANQAKTDAVIAANKAQAARSLDRSAMAEMKIRLEKSEAQLAQKEALLAEKTRLVTERENIIREWMHSDATFKLLAKKYGKKLGMTDEERLQDYREEILNQAEENPSFQKTELGKEVKRKLGLSGT